MYNIWLYFDVLCSAKSFSWNIDVKPSAPKYPMRRTIPYMESSCFALAELIDPDIPKIIHPPVTPKEITHSCSLYFLAVTITPHTITGTIFALFPSICTGKDTYFRAS